jgi:hypothetical protein
MEPQQAKPLGTFKKAQFKVTKKLYDEETNLITIYQNQLQMVPMLMKSPIDVFLKQISNI